MFQRLINFVSRKHERPIANNILHLDRIHKAHFFNAAAIAIRACELRGYYLSRAEDHAYRIWAKRLDRVDGYVTQSECLKAMRDYVDLQAKYQRDDTPFAPFRLWSPKPINNGPEAAA